MLRDYVYTLDRSLLKEAFQKFDITMPDNESDVALIEFRVITPDSFIWRFRIGGSIYYLYAEDFVGGLNDVKEKIHHFMKSDAHIEFIRAREPETFQTSGPNMSATTYAEPENVSDMMQFAVSSDYDFVFLGKSDESIDNAFFNDYG